MGFWDIVTGRQGLGRNASRHGGNHFNGAQGAVNDGPLGGIFRLRRTGRSGADFGLTPEARRDVIGAGRIANVIDGVAQVTTGERPLTGHGTHMNSQLERDFYRDANVGAAYRGEGEAQGRLYRNRYDSDDRGPPPQGYNPQRPYDTRPGVWQDPNASQPVAPPRGPVQSSPSQVGQGAYGLSVASAQALDDLKDVPNSMKVDAFNRLPLNQKNEIVDQVNSMNSLMGTSGSSIQLDAQGNIDPNSPLFQNLHATSRPVTAASPEPSKAAASAANFKLDLPSVEKEAPSPVGPQSMKTVDPNIAHAESVRQMASLGGGAKNTADATNKVEKLDFTQVKTGEVFDTKMLNQLSWQGYLDKKNHITIGQESDPNSMKVFMADNKIIGGMKDDKFISRTDLDTRLADVGKSVAGLERAAGIANTMQQIASITPDPAPEAPKLAMAAPTTPSAGI